MKPFLLPLLKCNDCEFTSKLRMVSTQAKKIELDEDMGLVKSRINLFTENNGEMLRGMSDALKDFECYELTDHGISDVVNGGDESLPALFEFLLGNEVVSGYLLCPSCNCKYPIKEGIVDFIDVERDDGS
jgi:uncharacterized protein YbaR (Trm112 family)